MKRDLNAVKKQIGALNTKYGSGVIGFGKDMKEQLTLSFIKTPSTELNNTLDGGLARGKIIEAYGPNSSGKTSLFLNTIAKNQKENPNFVAGWFETEGSVTWEDIEKFGIDTDRLVYWDQRSITAEQGLDILIDSVFSGNFDMIVLNSIAGLCCKSELEKGVEGSDIAVNARNLSKLFRIVTAQASKHKTTLCFVNQLRQKVGIMFGNPETTTGGLALGFYSSVRLDMRKQRLEKSDPITEDEGVKIKVKVVKNRFAKKNPYKTCEYLASYEEGITSLYILPDLLVEHGVMTKTGSWYNWLDENGEVRTINNEPARWRSKSLLVDFLKTNEKYFKYFEGLVEGSLTGTSLSNEEIKEIEERQRKIDEAQTNLEKELKEDTEDTDEKPKKTLKKTKKD